MVGRDTGYAAGIIAGVPLAFAGYVNLGGTGGGDLDCGAIYIRQIYIPRAAGIDVNVIAFHLRCRDVARTVGIDTHVIAFYPPCRDVARAVGIEIYVAALQFFGDDVAGAVGVEVYVRSVQVGTGDGAGAVGFGFKRLGHYNVAGDVYACAAGGVYVFQHGAGDGHDCRGVVVCLSVCFGSGQLYAEHLVPDGQLEPVCILFANFGLDGNLSIVYRLIYNLDAVSCREAVESGYIVGLDDFCAVEADLVGLCLFRLRAGCTKKEGHGAEQ